MIIPQTPQGTGVSASVHVEVVRFGETTVVNTVQKGEHGETWFLMPKVGRLFLFKHKGVVETRKKLAFLKIDYIE